MPKQTYHLPNLSLLRDRTAHYQRHQARLRELAGARSPSGSHNQSKLKKQNIKEDDCKAPSIIKSPSDSGSKRYYSSEPTRKRPPPPSHSTKISERVLENMRLYRALNSSTSVLEKYTKENQQHHDALRQRISRYLKNGNKVTYKHQKTLEGIKTRMISKEKVETDRSINLRQAEEGLKEAEKKSIGMRVYTASMSDDIFFEADSDRRRLRRSQWNPEGDDRDSSSLKRLEKIYRVSGRTQTEASQIEVKTRRSLLAEQMRTGSRKSNLLSGREAILEKLTNISSQTAEMSTISDARSKKQARDMQILSFTPETMKEGASTSD